MFGDELAAGLVQVAAVASVFGNHPLVGLALPVEGCAGPVGVGGFDFGQIEDRFLAFVGLPQLPVLAAPGRCRFAGRALLTPPCATSSALPSARNAALTAAESGKSRCTSLSSATILLPPARRSTYLPRTPPAKSYSGSKSRSGAFFILSSFLPTGNSRADQADALTAIDVNHNEHPTGVRLSDQDMACLVRRVNWIRDRHRQMIVERRGGLLKADTVLREISCRFCRIPFKVNRHCTTILQRV